MKIVSNDQTAAQVIQNPISDYSITTSSRIIKCSNITIITIFTTYFENYVLLSTDNNFLLKIYE